MTNKSKALTLAWILSFISLSCNNSSGKENNQLTETPSKEVVKDPPSRLYDTVTKAPPVLENVSVRDFVIPNLPVQKTYAYVDQPNMHRVDTYIQDDKGYFVLLSEAVTNGFAGVRKYRRCSEDSLEIRMHKEEVGEKVAFFENGEPIISVPNFQNGEQSAKWKYKDGNGDLFECSSKIEGVNYKGRSKEALIVTTKVYSGGELQDWATQKEYYLKGIGLWKITD